MTQTVATPSRAAPDGLELSGKYLTFTLAAEIEAACKAGTPDLAQKHYPQIERQFARLKREIEKPETQF